MVLKQIVPLLHKCAFSTSSISKTGLASVFRTHTCGELRKSAILEKVKLSGWIDNVRKFGPLTFLTLRDRYGITQVVFNEQENPDLIVQVGTLPGESVITIDGVVKARPDEMKNPKMKTGDIEVYAENLEVLNKSQALPMQIGNHQKLPSEEIRLKYRHLDLRRAELQRNLALRSTVTMEARKYLVDAGFLEIETPTLFKSTPEGAREFLVPTRKRGKFYALTQSPQQYKQLLMVGGLDRYFQIARCYRDESGRMDRQPEFTQIDLELSFVNQRQIMDIIETLVRNIWSAGWKLLYPDQAPLLLPKDFQVMKYRTAMDRYGCDKPDLRYGLEINDISPGFFTTDFSLFGDNLMNGGSLRVVNLKKLDSEKMSRKQIDELQRHIQEQAVDGCKTFVFKVEKDKEWKTTLAKKLSAEEIAYATEIADAEEGDILVLACGPNNDDVCTTLGRARTHGAAMLHERGLLGDAFAADNFKFLWVVDFPLFEECSETPGNIVATHHPFTAPREDDMGKLQEILKKQLHQQDEVTKRSLFNIRAQHFDLVCNGWELGGGSIRIHSGDMQRQVMEDVLQLSPALRHSFDHLLAGLSQGAPPHGGLALGLDRVVAILCQATSLRDVVAFPKSTTGNELMTDSPGGVTPEQLKEYFIEVTGAEPKL